MGGLGGGFVDTTGGTSVGGSSVNSSSSCPVVGEANTDSEDVDVGEGVANPGLAVGVSSGLMGSRGMSAIRYVAS